MKIKTTITLEDCGAPTTDITVTSTEKAVSIEVAGCLLPLSGTEALELGNLLHAASYRSRPEPAHRPSFGVAAGASASASNEAEG